MKYLILRYGGIGDLMPITAVCKELKRSGRATEIDFFCREENMDILENNPYIDRVFATRRFNGIDCVLADSEITDVANTWVPVSSYYHRYPTVIDYKNTVENNWWANLSNWYDMAFQAANIDPASVSDKSPEYVISDEEEREAQEMIIRDFGEGDHKILSCVVGGSSFLRAWREWPTFIEEFHKKYPDYKVMLFGDKRHTLLQLPQEESWLKLHMDDLPTRKAVALFAQCSIALSMDSGFMHLAEALGIQTIALFTTVPAWTRSLYYVNVMSYDQDSTCPKYPCASLDTWCPASCDEVMKNLNPRQMEMWGRIARNQVNIPVDIAQSGLHPQTFMEEFNYTVAQHRKYAESVPACVASHTVEKVLERIKSFV